MIKKINSLIVCMALLSMYAHAQSKAISSAILNLGTNTCGNRYAVTFSMIGNPFTTPYVMAGCAVNPPFGDIFSKFIAYNPFNNRIYINDIRSNDSRLYIYDMGLPNTYTCPAVMPLTPTFNYLYVPNNFEFDINGDLWSIRDLVGENAIIERIDEATGTILFNKTLTFPPGNAPNTLGSGDIVLTTNGRMFIVMGDSPGKFYEITNYNTAMGNASANFIQAMPRPCYGIMYINGAIELTGTDLGGSCYRYIYDLGTQVRGPELPFQLGYTPIDNSSITPATGLAKKLIGSSDVDSATTDLVYEIYAKNMGNVKLDNFNITDDLGAVFGASNISAVTVSFIAGGNPSNLLLNPAYDGVTNIKILNENQVLTNRQNGYIAVRISLRATNLINNTIYYNTAKSYGEIGNWGSRIVVVDSSNNGPVAAIDPNADGDPGDMTENIPTPYYFGKILPVRFIDIKAGRISNNLHSIRWSIAPPPSPVTKFDIEYSEDHSNWQIAGSVTGEASKNDFSFNYHTANANTLYYRVRAFESTGKSYLSAEAVVRKMQEDQNIKVTPNPADDFITVYSSDNNFTENRRVQILDVSGKKIFDQPYSKQNMEIKTSQYPNGYYVVNIINRGNIFSTQVVIKHTK